MPDRSDLMQRRALPLGAKVLMTQARIREWYNHFNGDVYVSFSGGKDSTVLAHLVRDMYPDVPLIFSNTGLEYPEIQNFARRMGAEFLRPKMMFSEVISTYGYPIISKEISEAIYYARRIRNGGGMAQQRSTERISTENEHTKKQNADGKICMDSKRRNVLTGGNGKIFMGGYKDNNLHGQHQTQLAHGRERANSKIPQTVRKRIQFAGQYGRITRGVADDVPG